MSQIAGEATMPMGARTLLGGYLSCPWRKFLDFSRGLNGQPLY